MKEGSLSSCPHRAMTLVLCTVLSLVHKGNGCATFYSSINTNGILIINDMFTLFQKHFMFVKVISCFTINCLKLKSTHQLAVPAPLNQ